MKRSIITALSVIFLTSVVESCKKKGCTDPTATNYDASAKEDDGSCTSAGATLMGNYLMRDSSRVPQASFTEIKNYTLVISQGVQSDRVIVRNINNLGWEFPATVSGNTFLIADTFINSGEHFSGNGTLSGNQLTTYFMSDGPDDLYIYGSGIKQ